jgi:GR25 family glycosyltransferase involved in LPS biosynthesis
MLDTLFDKIYVIWGRDPLRMEYIKNHFSKRNIDNYKFIHSITPENLFTKSKKIRFQKLWDVDACKPPDAIKSVRCGSPYPLSLGEVCCSYGHLKAWKTAICDGVNSFLVIEDDAVIDEELCNDALHWKEYIPDDWDIIHFHSWRAFGGKREPELTKKRKQINDYFYTGYKEYGGTVCYSLTTSIAKILLNHYYPIRLPSDGIIAQLSTTSFSRKYYNAYVFHPFLCTNTIFESQIDTEKQISKKYLTRQQRYNLSKVKFDPTVL